MPNYMEEAFAPAEAKYKAAVMFETWGHLEPKMGKFYPCTMLFSQTETGLLVCIRSDFGPELGGSPGLHEETQDFVADQIEQWEKANKSEYSEGRIFQFKGTYTRLRSGEPRWSGKVKEIVIS